MFSKIKVFGKLLKKTYVSWDKNEPYARSATIAYYALFSLPSLLIIVVSIAGYFFGRDKKVRVNTISQSPTPTTAGQGVKGFDGFIAYAEKMSPLGNATAMDCANYTVTLFSNLTKRVTLQNLYNDGGFSNMGVSDAVMDTFVGEE